MKTTFFDLLQLLRHAAGPEDVFSTLAMREPAALKRRYHELAAIVHPDHNPGHVAEATEAFRRLQDLYVVAQRWMPHDRRVITITSKQQRYNATETSFGGDLCDLFVADATGGQVVLKVVRRASNNDLLQAEARVLRRIERELGGEPARAHFPRLVEHFLLRDETGSQRQVNVLQAETGYLTLAEVLRAYPGGIDAADAAWMFNRMLAVLGITHSLGLVHGALVPSHVLVRPADHNGMLVDWCYSVPNGEPMKAVSPPYSTDYPPEALAKQPVSPATDVYMAARCMVRLLGGDGDPATLPVRVPRPIQALLRSCLLPSPWRRADDAWQLFDDFQEILRDLYGPPSFRPFYMPATA